jgi:alpha-glucoside transport system permease protein
MEGIAGTRARLVWAINLSVIALVLLWTVPTFGLLVSSFRDKDQLAVSGWWTSLTASEQSGFVRTAAPVEAQRNEGGEWVIDGTLLPEGGGRITGFGTSSRSPGSSSASRQGVEERRKLSKLSRESGELRLVSGVNHASQKSPKHHKSDSNSN